MSDNGNIPGTTITATAPNRIRASGPLLILALLFVVAASLTWYFTWFGRELSDSDLANYLVDEKHPRHVQHALVQVQQRLVRGNVNARQWYPQILKLAGSSETEFRLTVAWLMGFDNKSAEFHQALLKLLADPEPIVRRNAALALVRFNDTSGRQELRSILKPYAVPAPVEGVIVSALPLDSKISRGALLARLLLPNSKIVEVRSPLPGKIEQVLAQSGAKLAAGDTLATLQSDEESVWEALRGLALVGEPQDLPIMQLFTQEPPAQSDRVKQQAVLTAKSIESRAVTGEHPAKQ